MLSKTDEKFLAKWRNFAGKKWKYVVIEGVLKQGIMFAVLIYVVNFILLKVAEPSFKNLLISFLLMPVFQIPLSLYLYKKFQQYYLDLTSTHNQ